MHEEKLAWFRLARTHGIGPIIFWRLLKKFQFATSAITYLKKQSKYQIFSEQAALKELKTAKELGIKILCIKLQKKLLNPIGMLPDCPPVIWTIGNLDLLNKPSIAIVGGRNASYHGKCFTKNFAKSLADHNLVIVSGLARGIDQAAHWGAIDKGTIAVLPGGVDILYPPENQDLYNLISQKGLLISEMPVSSPIRAEYFPRRNRLISGLSLGVIVIEAALSSGSLITANYALEHNRTIFVVPGAPEDPRNKGGHQLIKQGALLVDDITDILDNLKPLLSNNDSSEKNYIDDKDLPPHSLNDSQNTQYIADQPIANNITEKIINEFSAYPITIHDLLNKYPQMQPQKLMELLTELELKNVIIRNSYDSFCLR